MIWGMTTETFTSVHVVLSLIGIGAGLIVLFGLLGGIISLVILAVAIVARYGLHLAGSWRRVYVVCAAIALYLNVFVGVTQAALAPTQAEPPFALAQLVVLALFASLTVVATRKARG